MNLNLDKFWEWLQKWSVGKIAVTLVLLYMLFGQFEIKNFIQFVFFIGVLFELFDLCHNRVTDPKERPIGGVQTVLFNLLMVLSFFAILIMIFIYLQYSIDLFS